MQDVLRQPSRLAGDNRWDPGSEETERQSRARDPAALNPNQPHNGNPLTLENLAKHTRLNPARAQRTVEAYLRGLQLPWADPDQPRSSALISSVQPAQQQRTFDVDNEGKRSHAGRTRQVLDESPRLAPPETAEPPRMHLERQRHKASFATREVDQHKPPIDSAKKSGNFRNTSLKAREGVPSSPQRDVAQQPKPLDLTAAHKSVTVAPCDPTKLHLLQSQRSVLLANNETLDADGESNGSSQIQVDQIHRKAKRRKKEPSSKSPQVQRKRKPPDDNKSDGDDRLMKRQRKLLQRRLEKRRAKAVIIKDRSSLNQPSKTAVKAVHKAQKGVKRARSQEGSSVSRGEVKQADVDGDQLDVISVGSGSNCNFETTRRRPADRESGKRKKRRRNDTERNVAILKEAMPSKHQRAANRSVLERAANIIPSGRVTVKAKTGIYNYGQASAREAVTTRPSLPDLAFDEFPFLNPPKNAGSRPLPQRKTSELGNTGIASKMKAMEPRQAYHTGEKQGKSQAVYGGHFPAKRHGTSVPITPREHERQEPPYPSAARRVPNSNEHIRGETTHQKASDETSRLHQLPRGLTLEAQELVCKGSRISGSLMGGGDSIKQDQRSRIASEGGLALSSLTGLSATSLARRRLAQRHSVAPEGRIADPSTSSAQLNQQLRHFALQGTAGCQAFGPSAKYGTALIARCPTPRISKVAVSSEHHADQHIRFQPQIYTQTSPNWSGNLSATSHSDLIPRQHPRASMHVAALNPAQAVTAIPEAYHCCVTGSEALRQPRDTISFRHEPPIDVVDLSHQWAGAAIENPPYSLWPSTVQRPHQASAVSPQAGGSSIAYDQQYDMSGLSHGRDAGGRTEFEYERWMPRPYALPTPRRNAIQDVDAENTLPYQQGFATLHAGRLEGSSPFRIANQPTIREERFWRPHYL